nr:MAG TPA: hypothetical protein [Caudoviricetes sp.]
MLWGLSRYLHQIENSFNPVTYDNKLPYTPPCIYTTGGAFFILL